MSSNKNFIRYSSLPAQALSVLFTSGAEAQEPESHCASSGWDQVF